MAKSVLSQPNSVAILVQLLDSGGSAKPSHIQEAVGDYNSVKASGERLEKEGLVTITEYKGQCRYILYELTGRGRQVANHLKKAEDALKGLPVNDSILTSGRRVRASVNVKGS